MDAPSGPCTFTTGIKLHVAATPCFAGPPAKWTTSLFDEKSGEEHARYFNKPTIGCHRPRLYIGYQTHKSSTFSRSPISDDLSRNTGRSSSFIFDTRPSNFQSGSAAIEQSAKMHQVVTIQLPSTGALPMIAQADNGAKELDTLPQDWPCVRSIELVQIGLLGKRERHNLSAVRVLQETDAHHS